MNWLTRTFLVFLRLAIGCHFLIEGMAKIQDPRWTSANFVREASGPFAGTFRAMNREPTLREQLTLLNRYDRIKIRARRPPGERIPEFIEHDWNSYFERFARYYGLEGEQRTRAELKLNEEKARLIAWLETGVEPVKKASPGGGPAVEIEQTIDQRLVAYDAKLKELENLQSDYVATFSSTPEPAKVASKVDRYSPKNDPKAKVATAKAEAAAMRTSLLSDLDKQTAKMKKALEDTLTADQKKRDPLPPDAGPFYREWEPISVADWVIPIGLVVMGASILLGSLAVAFGAVGRKVKLGPFGWTAWFFAMLAGTGLLALAVKSGWIPYVITFQPLIEQWAKQEWTYWLIMWTVPIFALVMLLSTAGRTVYNLPRWHRLGWFGWLVTTFIGAGALLIWSIIFIIQDWPATSFQGMRDWLVIWGVVAVSLCLLIGFLTRSASLGGAFLILIFMLPVWPETARDAGQFVKTLVELLALLALCTLPTGRWLGVDGILQYVNPWRWVARPADMEVASGERGVPEVIPAQQ